ncbi:MAG: FIST C-terminal domain-containing protein [Actinomycetota bacterium]|nr:FIST C-terminal domain-containing protein [Actinomycetota bacterium]
MANSPAAASVFPSRLPGRWLALGQSDEPDAGGAGARAARRALAHADAKLLVVFCSEAYDLDRLLAAVNEESGQVPLVGCSTAGEIGTSGPGDAGVVVMALGGADFTVRTAVAPGASGDLRGAGATVAACVDGVAHRPHRVLLLLSDGLAGDQQEVVRGAYGVVGAEVPLVGGCAGDGLKMRRTFQFHGSTVLHDAVVGAALGSEGSLGIGVSHGWRRVGAPMVVTGSSGTRVHSLDEEPALDVYLERLEAPAEVRTDPGSFTRFALTHPLGISRRSGEEVRFIADADFDDRSIGCIAEVPQGGLAWIMEGDEDSVLQASDDACEAAVGDLDGRPPLGFLAFDCIARRGVLGDVGIRREIERISAHAGGAPVAGFYTYGEIARVGGAGGFHNQTLVVLALG